MSITGSGAGESAAPRLSLTCVRYAVPADLPALADIEAEADAMFSAMWAGSGLELEDWPAATPGEQRAARPGFILTVGQPILGFAHVIDLVEHGSSGLHLDQVAVRPDAGRRGIGTMLLRAVMGEVLARGQDTLTLMTYADVLWNGPWYAREGFAEISATSHPVEWERLTPLRAIEDDLGLAAAGRRVGMVVGLTDDPAPLPAVSVIPVRERGGALEVFIQHRVHTMDFAPGVVVFPGGRVDPIDESTAYQSGISVAEACAVREVAEEAGAVIDPADLIPWDRWITPVGYPKRFDVEFFLLPVADGSEFVHSTGEAIDSVWMPVADLVIAVETGQLNMVPPTRTIIDELSALRTLKATVALQPEVVAVHQDIATLRPRER